MKISIIACAGLCALVAVVLADPVEKKDLTIGDSSSHRSTDSGSSGDMGKGPISTWPPTVDLRTQIAGTVWKATPGAAGLRPGLDGTLAFNGKDVGRLNYRYEVNSHDGTVTIYFTRGDTQLMLLTEGGRHLCFTFRGEDYSYDFVSKTPPVYSQNQ